MSGAGSKRRGAAVRGLRLAAALGLCLNLMGCMVLETLEAIAAMILSAIIVLVQALLPSAIQLAPLFVEGGPGSGPAVYQIVGRDAEGAEAAVTRLLKDGGGSLVAGEVRVVRTTDAAASGREALAGAGARGVRTAAVVIVLERGEDAEALAARLRARMAVMGLRPALYEDSGALVLAAGAAVRGAAGGVRDGPGGRE
jgi:hypothetical protein